MLLLLLGPLMATAVAGAGVDRKEHKVHNIVLYPERHSWCQTTPIRQVVSMPGYAPLTIDNHVCVGACYSYSIPRTQPAEPGELIGPYCDSCQPKTTRCYRVTLRRANVTAGGDDDDVDAAPMRKRVQVIADCSCSSCSRAASAATAEEDECDADDGDVSELPASLVASGSQEQRGDGAQETPELMALQPPRASSVVASHNSAEVAAGAARTYRLDDGLRRLLRRTQSDDDGDDGDDDDMRHLVEVMRGASGQLSDRDVVDFVNWVNEHEYDDDDDSTELDALKLKTALDAFHRRELRLKHRKFALADEMIEGSHLGLGQRKGAHVGMGIATHAHSKLLAENVIPSGDDEEEEEDDAQTKHRVGDAIGAHGDVAHLAMGPHGSLVLGAERLSIDSDEMAPNREGTVIDYHHRQQRRRQHHHHHQQQQRAPAPPPT